MKNYFKLSGVLFLVCGLAAGSLAFVYQGTKAKIAEQAAAETREALKEVFKQADKFKDTVAGKQWEAYNTGIKIGDVLAVEARGYGGAINIILGVDMEKKVTGIRIISHTETPGLGAKITARQFLDQFTGQGIAELRLIKEDPQAGKIDAITAATISSRAVVNAVREAVTALP